MSASLSTHGPFGADARLIEAGEFSKEPFVTLDIKAQGVSVALIRIDAEGLEAVSAACGAARVLLESLNPPADPWASKETEPGTITPSQQSAIMAASKERGFDRGKRLGYVSGTLGRTVTSTNELSYVDAQKVLAELGRAAK